MVNAALKRTTDILVSMGVLLVIWPLLIVIAVLIRQDSKGPAFYRGVRVGKHGKHFRMFKFRTMIVGAERLGGAATPKDDPRITRLGYHIRRLNLDELPQFINVLKGDMSIVGPRPEVPQYVALFTDEEKEILSVRPGITDWATIRIADLGNILAGSEDPEKMQREKVWPEKHRLNLEYVRHHTWLTDIQIMFVTLKVHLLDRLFTKRVRQPKDWQKEKRNA